MPNVTIEWLEGRTIDQKRKVIAGITELLVDEAGARREAVQVTFRDMSKESWGRGGLLGIDRTDVVPCVRHLEPFPDVRPLTVTEEGLGLTDGAPGPTGAVEHIAFRSADIRNLAERAEQSGITVIKGPGPGPYGLTVYLADPDGNKIELFSETEE
jgi:4-oxalocrotonate tautomerase family enzyme